MMKEEREKQESDAFLSKEELQATMEDFEREQSDREFENE